MTVNLLPLLARRHLLLMLLLMLLSAAPAMAREAPVVLAFGDSLTAGYGLPREQAWPALLQQRLQAARLPHRVVNAGISGDTTAGGLARLPRTLARERPQIVILELGANDALRGLSLSQTRANLARMIELSQAAGARVLLVGLRIPPNYGSVYANKFQQIYPELARQYQVPLLPFLLEGVAGQASLNLDDGIHPNARGQRILSDTVWRNLQPLLKTERQARQG